MNPNTYKNAALRTNPEDYQPIIERLSTESIAGLLHAGIGLATESGEFLDQLKKHIFYGRELDEVNLREELGDAQWYLALACHYLDYGMEAMMEDNLRKLQSRFPNRFTKEGAIVRDLEKERKAFQ